MTMTTMVTMMVLFVLQCNALSMRNAKREAVVWVDGITKSHNGVRKVLDEASLTLHAGERLAIVGHNGCGKSTLLSIISGEETVDDGEMRLRRGLRVAFVEQEPLVDPKDAPRSVEEILLSGDGPGVVAAREYTLAARELDDPQGTTPEKAQLRFERAAERMTLDEGWSVEAAVAVASEKLNIAHLSSRRVADLSGGERKRVSLARALLDKGDVIVLDEPTNHLDLWAVRWLEEYLASEALSKACVVFVSHDRQFTENVANAIIELDGGLIFEHQKSEVNVPLVEAYLSGKAKRLSDAASETAASRSKLKTELAWLRRGARARQTKSVERIDRVNQLVDKVQDAGAYGRADSLELVEDDGKKKKKVNKGDRKKKTILTVDGLTNQGDPTSEVPLFADFARLFADTDRIAIVGANGAGKSSLVRAIVGQAASEGRLVGATEAERAALVSAAPVDAETVKFANIKVGYYAQNPPSTDESTPMEAAMAIVARREATVLGESDRVASCVDLLKRYQFEDASAWRAPIDNLSGGERRRLQLMAVLEARPDLLVLDEPSNDLDLGALQSLERYLCEQHAGALLLVSHDRALIDATCDELLVLPGDGAVSSYAGSMSGYLALLDSAEPEDVYEEEEEEEDDPERRKMETTQRKRILNAPKIIAKLGIDIEKLESEVSELDTELEAVASDASKLAVLFEKKKALQEKVDKKYEEWAQLDDLVSSV